VDPASSWDIAVPGQALPVVVAAPLPTRHLHDGARSVPVGTEGNERRSLPVQPARAMAPGRGYGHEVAHPPGECAGTGCSVNRGAQFCEHCGRDRDWFVSAQSTYRDCPTCGAACCADCWNLGDGACLRCAPFRLVDAPGPRRIVNVALPVIRDNLHSGKGIEWVVTAYLLAVAVSQPATG